MLLCVDIGNTNITAGVFYKEKLIAKFKIPTDFININNRKKIAQDISKKLGEKIAAKDIKEAVMCSVVPQAAIIFKNVLRKDFGIRCIEAGKEIKVPIKNCYSPPKKVGQDRLVNAAATIWLYGKPAIVIDFGTCITFDCISSRGGYLGGLIMPGIGMTLNALFEKTALLPKIKMTQRPAAVIGHTTKESITSGVYHSILGACEFIIKKIKKEKLGDEAQVIGTGGDVDLFRTKNKLIDVFNPTLTLEGLNLIYKTFRFAHKESVSHRVKIKEAGR